MTTPPNHNAEKKPNNNAEKKTPTNPAPKKAAATAQASPLPAPAEVLVDLRKMINNAEYSDVDFVCKGKVRVHASRLLLMARSPAFKQLLTADRATKSTKEFTFFTSTKNDRPEFPLPDVSAPILLSIMEFLYTGAMMEYERTGSSMALDELLKAHKQAYQVISAARHFQLHRVVEIVREFLVKSPAKVADVTTKGAITLSAALEFGTLPGSGGSSKDGDDSIPLNRILNSRLRDLEPIHLRALSPKAFGYLLQKTKSKPDMQTTISFGEYLTFRQIILWSAIQARPEEAEAAVNSFLPDATMVVSLFKDAQKLELFRNREAAPQSQHLRSVLLDKESSASQVQSLMKSVEFRRIHPLLLHSVVRPSEIVPDSELVKAVGFREYQTGPNAPRYRWEHGSSDAVVGDGYAIAKTAPGVGFSRYTTAMASNEHGVCEWDIIVEELCANFCEIGFYKGDGTPSFDGSTLAQQPTGWALSHDLELGTRISDRGKADGWRPFNKSFARPNARVRIRLDMFRRSCSLAVDKDEFQLAWSDLPDGVYFPAVSLGNGTPLRSMGRVRIEFVNAFEMW